MYPNPSMSAWTPRKHADAFARMLQDEQRMTAFRQALDACVTPDSIVADVGTGLGVLALFAAKAGAKRVYAIEKQAGAAELAQQMFAANGVADRVQVIIGEAQNIHLPEQVDIVVSELIGTAGSDEHIQQILGGFCRRNLRPGGQVLPREGECLIAPSSYSDLTNGLASPSLSDLALEPLSQLPGEANMSFRPAQGGVELLAEPMAYERIAVGHTEVIAADPLQACIDITTAGILRSFVLWFRATVGADKDGHALIIENRPGEYRPSWSSAVFTIAAPVAVKPGDSFMVSIDTGRRSHCLNWHIRHHQI